MSQWIDIKVYIGEVAVWRFSVFRAVAKTLLDCYPCAGVVFRAFIFCVVVLLLINLH